MVKSRREAGEDVEACATDSENQLLFASSNVGEGSDGESSETESSEGGSESGGESSSENVPINELSCRRAHVVGSKQKVGEMSVKKGKQKVAEVEIPGRKKAKVLKVSVHSRLGDASGWLDCAEKFVLSPAVFRGDEYFKSYGVACYYEPKWNVVAYDFLSEELGKLDI